MHCFKSDQHGFAISLSGRVYMLNEKRTTIDCTTQKNGEISTCVKDKKSFDSLTCCKLGVDDDENIADDMWSGVVLGDSSDDDEEQFDWEFVSYWCMKLSVDSILHGITGDVSNIGDIDRDDVGMTWDCCDVCDEYEYSNGFVIAMSELRISGVRGVLEQNSTPTPSNGGVDSDVWLKLYIFPWLFFSLI